MKAKRPFRQHLGAFGERLAAYHLEAKGYRVVARNVRGPAGEIDLVAIEADTLVIVEVRTRRVGRSGLPEETISARKAQRLFALAEAYAAEHPELPSAARIDLVAIELGADGRVERVNHIEDIVSGP